MTSEPYERLRVVCKEYNTTPYDLCIEITGNQDNLSAWETGDIQIEHLEKIAEKFNVSTEYLLLPSANANEILHARQTLRSWLKTTNKKFEEIEKFTKTNYATVHTWSLGVGSYFNNKIFILADLIGCSVDELLGRDDKVLAFGDADNKDTQPPIEEDSTDF